MTVGNLIQLESRGPEDMTLYGNPQVTYFQQVYKRSTNFAIDYYKIPDNYFAHIGFGDTIKVKLPFRADLVGGLYLKVKFKDLVRTSPFYFPEECEGSTLEPQFTSYANGIGVHFIEWAKFYINGMCVEHINAELIFLYNELHNSQNRKNSFYRMVRYYENEFRIGYTNQKDLMTYLPLPFWFTRDPSVYLPTCGLQNSELSVEIKLKPLSKCLIRQFNYTGDTAPGVDGYIQDETCSPCHGSVVGNGFVPAQYAIYPEEVVAGIEYMELYTKNIFLEKQEQLRFKNKEQQYLIETLNIGNFEMLREPNEMASFFYNIDFYHPTKYLFWVLQREDVAESNFWDNYTTTFNIKYGDGTYTFDYEDHLLKEAVILANNMEITPVNDAIFLSAVQLYENFRSGTDYNVYEYNFALNPCSHQPMGTFNFSRVLSKGIRVSLVDGSKFTNNDFKPNVALRMYSHAFNVLVIKDGLAGLVYQK